MFKVSKLSLIVQANLNLSRQYPEGQDYDQNTKMLFLRVLMRG